MTAQLGVGEFEYAPAPDGGDITIVHGPQGGWHMDLAGQLAGSNELVKVSATVIVNESGAQIGGAGQEGDPAVLLANYANCSGDFVKARILLDDDPTLGQDFFCSLHGKTLDIMVTVTNIINGEQVQGSMSLVARPDSVDAGICP